MIKTILFITALAAGALLIGPSYVSAQMPAPYGTEGSRSGMDGRIFQQTASATNLSNNDYEKLGEEAMDLMMGSQHETMDKAIETSMGSEFLKNMHIAMGKMSLNKNSTGLRPWIPMMQMMGFGSGWGMMGNWNMGLWGSSFWALTCWVFGIALFVLIILASWRLWQLIQKGRN